MINKYEKKITNIIGNDEHSFIGYINEVSKINKLNASDELKLITQFNNGEKIAGEKIITSNLNLVITIATKYQKKAGNYNNIMDLIEEGNLGLIHALKKFDATLGFRFATYANYWVQFYIEKYILNNKLIKLPIYLNKQIIKFNKICQKEGIEVNSIQAVNFLSKSLNLDKRKVQNTIQHANSQYIDDLEVNLSKINYEKTMQINQLEENIDKERLELLVMQAISELNELQQSVICKRFGIHHLNSYSIQKTSEELNISKERIRNLEKNAIKKMYNFINNNININIKSCKRLV